MAIKKPGKKPAKQLKLEKKIAGLKKEHGKLEKQKKTVGARLDREGKVREKQLAKLERAIERANAAFNRLDGKSLPSQSADFALREKLYKIEDKIRLEENLLKQLTASPNAPPNIPSGEETEE